jgi:hypothetical protein
MFMKILKVGALVLVAGFIIIQFFQIDKANPPTDEAHTLESTTQLPPDINMILSTSCNDCHSHKTTYPWYANIQPSGWFLKDHINHGREHLNFSIWNTYDLKKRKKKMDEICEEVKSARMPLPSYLWIHGDAVLTESQAKALCDWAKAEEDRLDTLRDDEKK